MNLSICDPCGGHVSLGHEASNRCECRGCGRDAFERDPLPPVGGIDDSELVALRAENTSLKKQVEGPIGKEGRDYCTKIESRIVSLRAEVARLREIERLARLLLLTESPSSAAALAVALARGGGK